MLIYKISSICIECRDYDCYEEIVVKKDHVLHVINWYFVLYPAINQI